MEDLEQLESMGFPRDLAGKALQATSGDVAKATAILVDPAAARKLSNPIPPGHALRNSTPTSGATLRSDAHRATPEYHTSTPRPPDHNPPPRPLPSSEHYQSGQQTILRPDSRQQRSDSYHSQQTTRAPVSESVVTSTNGNGLYPSAPVLPSRSESNNQTIRGVTPTASGESSRSSRQQQQSTLRAGEVVRDVCNDQAMPQAPSTFSSSNDLSSWPVPRGPEYLSETLQVHMFVDVRDTLGKWLEAEVIGFSEGNPVVHYVGWDAKWDEPIREPHRIAPCHKYSSKATCDDYGKDSNVFIWLKKPARCMWAQGTVTKVDGRQMQVQYLVGDKKYQYWYHADTDEIRQLRREPSAEKPPISVHPDLTNGNYFQGQFLEVRDNVTWSWRAAEVRRLRPETNEILIHYDGFAASWDEYLHVEKDVARIKPLGADIPDTPEIALAKKEDEEFREGLKSKGLTVVDVERDGNCLYRSVAHQMYNDVNRHLEVRKACCDYMQQDQEFFSCFIPEDFGTYVARQQKPNEWGDHPEVVALRELYNVNVEVYDKSNFPTPLYVTNDEGVNCVMRLTFHGQNHYNSLVKKDTALPLLPLAQSSKVNLKQLRQSQVKNIDATSPVSADTKEDPTLERQNTIRSKFGFGRKPMPIDREPRTEDIVEQIQIAIRKFDRKGYILSKDCFTVVCECLGSLRDAKQQYYKSRGQKVEYSSVNQEYENSLKHAHRITQLLIQSCSANEMLVHVLGFEKNLRNLDDYWGKAIA